jgi:hypothetical protein
MKKLEIHEPHLSRQTVSWAKFKLDTSEMKYSLTSLMWPVNMLPVQCMTWEVTQPLVKSSLVQ